MKGIIKVDYNGIEVAFQKDEVCLTDLWRAAGCPENKDPRQWLRTEQAIGLIEELNKSRNEADVGKKHIDDKSNNKADTGKNRFVRTAKGGKFGGGNTWACRDLAVSYAGYLSPKLQLFVNRVFLEHLQELANPELAYSRGRQRAIEGWKRQGKSDTWIDKRIKSMDTNIEHRQVLADHGVDKMGFVMCANNINCGILGTTGKKYKEKNGFPVGVELRNCMDESQIVSGMLAEILSDKKIIKDNIYGNKPCAKTYYDIAKEISTVVNRIIN